MRQVRIVTDSTADIPAELQHTLDIHVVPLKVHFGTDTYQDGVDMGSEAFLRSWLLPMYCPPPLNRLR